MTDVMVRGTESFGVAFRRKRDGNLSSQDSFRSRGANEHGPLQVHKEGIPDSWHVSDIEKILMFATEYPVTKVRISFRGFWSAAGLRGSSWSLLVDKLEQNGFLPTQHNYVCNETGGDIYISLFGPNETC